MNREEIKDFLIEIKSFYPRFALVDPDDYTVRTQTLDAWYDMIGFKSKEDCRKLLQDHIAGPNGDKVPGISTFAGGRQRSGIICTAWIRNGLIYWKPDINKDALSFGAVWDGAAYRDSEGRLWAVPEEE